MANKKCIPRPFFDKQSTLNDLPYNCIKETLTSLNIDNIFDEYSVILDFLKSYTGSEDTYTAYRREIEKLLQWSWIYKKVLVKTLNRNAIIEFMEFIQNPPGAWISNKTVQRFTQSTTGDITYNKTWKPFVVRIAKSEYKSGKIAYKHNFVLSRTSVQATFATLSSFFTYLTQEQYIQINPVALIRQKSKYIQKEQNMKITRKLSSIQWRTVIEAASKLVEQDDSHLRMYFILSCFYLLGLRISELSETPNRIPCMGDFAPDHNGAWWFTTVGKGNKIREVAVPSELLDILKKYRTSRGLSPLPSRGDNNPIVHKTRGSNGLGTRQIRNIIQEAFDLAVDSLKKQDKLDDAMDLESATVHWLRHTSISNDVQSRPREHIRDDVGHTNPATMDKYIDIDRKERHASAKQKSLLPD